MRFYKRMIYPLLGSFLVISMISCVKKENKEQNEDSQKLFEQSALLIKEFSEKIKTAQDSASVDSLSELFEKKLTQINFDFPAETDLKLSEQDNDSLFKLIRQYQNIKILKLSELEKTDTLENIREGESL